MTIRAHPLHTIVLAVVLTAIFATPASAWNTNLSTSASGPIVLGSALTDTATLAATSGIAPTGTITFKLYGPNDSSCKTQVGSAVTDAVSANGSYRSPPITPSTPGTYRWVASYSGDAHNLAAGPTACTDSAESSVVTKVTPALSTAANGSVSLGEAIRDQAHLSGALNPTGTIMFRLYGPNDPSCSAQVGVALTTTVNGNGDYTSASVIPGIPGTYRWVASYSGDADNAAVEATACADPSEVTVVSKVAPVLATTASAPAALGEALRDTATLTGGVNLTGTLTFKLYGPGDTDCTTQAGEAVTATVNGNGSYVSPSITPTAVGTYHWVASYSGDANNAPSGSTSCTEPAESVSVTVRPAPGMTVVKTQRLAGSQSEDPRKLAYGVHRLTVVIIMSCGHTRIARTLIFIHCRPAQMKPTFTG